MAPDTNVISKAFAADNEVFANDPQIELDDIQADVLLGLQKKAENFVFFTIQNAADFKSRALTTLVRHITTLSQALIAERMLAVNKASGGPLLRVRGLNIGFTAEGLKTLGSGTDGMDASFLAGALQQAPALNDPVDDKGALSTWLPQFRGAIHGVLLVTGETPEAMDEHTNKIMGDLGDAIQEVHREQGVVRPGREEGHEHFGFKDGVSQPGVRGLTPRQNPDDPDQGLPGQDLIWPGQFVFGYSAQDPQDPIKEGPPPPLPFPWMRNGSYMVFRRLEQRVPEFDGFIDAQAKALGVDPALLQARLVGRWKSGAPLLLAPMQDDPVLGDDPTANNDFVYSQDPQQRRCPYAGHIRKTYPRDDLGDALGSNEKGEAAAQVRRIMRAGITFGPELDDDEKNNGQTAGDKSRGLLFVCYQTSIVEQFEFIQQSWANNPDFVFGKTRPGTATAVKPGIDMIIGQAGGNRSRDMDEPLPNYPTGNFRSTLTAPHDFVVPTGGTYCFMPALHALQSVLLA